ncbi:MAG: isoprenyl transferase [Bacteroidales bacterium]|jgi:undecaprenyl diphosphate synthase|nr:isoprenyl transferase [Bacteroidota bacterium]
MSQLEQIDLSRVPKHVAVIMDGNGRWATKHGLSRAMGHKEGVKSVKTIVEASTKLGIQYMTLYAFSTENWDRPKDEVQALMKLMVETLTNETPTLIENKIKLSVIGDINRLDKDLRTRLNDSLKATSSFETANLIVALSYSSRWEITEAAKKIVSDVVEKKIDINKIDESIFGNYLNTENIPDPDLMIRTSGEYRISNFLLWQMAYTELYFTDVLWPDFSKEDFYEAIVEYQKRDRRFGKIKL